MTHSLDRRALMSGSALAALASSFSASQTSAAPLLANNLPEIEIPSAAKVNWPIWDKSELQKVIEVVQSGRWGRTGGGTVVPEFEEVFRSAMQSKHCIATTSGTTALFSVMGALGIGPGDEVIIPPYTFVATFNAVTMNYALPVFADVDRETFQMDPDACKRALTPQTKAIMPVHLGGSVADMDAINEVAKPQSLAVVEDACQAPLAQWRGKPVGNASLAGCISFQSSKNISAGEGGAVLTNDDAFANAVYDFHSPGGAHGSKSDGRGANFRMTQFQAAVLLGQLARAESHYKIRETNAAQLTRRLEQIPGISPAKLTDGCTRSAWHLYMFRFDPEKFAGRSRAEFLQALAAKKVSASVGYSRLPVSDHVNALASNPHYERIYGKDFMKRWLERNHCPANDQLCSEAVWLSQTQLLSEPSEIERIADAIAEVQAELSK